MKPSNLVFCLIKATKINSYQIKQVEIDIRHVNYGFEKGRGYSRKARSNLTVGEIVSFFESLDGLEINIERDENWEYFVIDKIFIGKNKKYRIVFCIDIKYPMTAGIITMYQIKRTSL